MVDYKDDHTKCVTFFSTLSRCITSDFIWKFGACTVAQKGPEFQFLARNTGDLRVTSLLCSNDVVSSVLRYATSFTPETKIL